MTTRPPLDIAELTEHIGLQIVNNDDGADRAENLQLAQINLLADIAQSLQEIQRATHHLAVISGQGHQ